MYHNKIIKHSTKILAILLGIVAVAVYIYTGRSSLDQNTRELQSSDKKVESVNESVSETGDKTLLVECRDGSSYEVYYPPGETDYEAVAAGKCQ